MIKRFHGMVFIVLLVLSLCAGQPAARGDETPSCPVCGYLVGSSGASQYVYGGKTYVFCEPGCKAYFMQNPAQFASGRVMDVVCGMTIDRDSAVSIIHNNRRLSFCSEHCCDVYRGDPGAYDLSYDVVVHEVGRIREMKYSTEFEGRPYYFFGELNKKEFEQNPDAYIYAECPIGGDVFLRKDAAGRRVHKGKTYYFGCNGCLAKFDSDPDAALKGGPSACSKSCSNAAGVKVCPKATGAQVCPRAKMSGGCSKARNNAAAGDTLRHNCPHSK